MRKSITLGLCAVGFWMLSAANAAQPLADPLLQQELRQEQIRISTERVGQLLRNVVQEFERNGLEGDDVEILKAIEGVLGKLSANQIQRVVELLRGARVAPDGKQATENALAAFAGQKNVSLQLRQLLLEYQRQQAINQLAVAFALLAKRQDGNLYEAVDLVKRSGTGSARPRDISLQLQHSEQDSLGEETKLLVVRLAKLSKELDSANEPRPKNALAHAEQGKLTDTQKTATTDLKAGNLLSAAGNEKTSRDLLFDIARLLSPNRDKAEVIRQALLALEKTIAEQKQIIEQTKAADPKTADPKATDPKVADPKTPKATPAELEAKQSALADKTDSIRKDVEPVVAQAAEQLKESVEQQLQANAALNKPPTPDAKQQVAEKQAGSLEKMEAAKQTLEQQLAKLEKEKPQDKIATAKELLEKVQQLKKEEEAIKKEAAKPDAELPKQAEKQAEVKNKTDDVRQKAAEAAPEAAKAIAEAARQMEKAKEELAKSKNAPEAQQAAIDALSKAEQQLAEQLAQLEKAAQEKAALEKVSEKLAKLIEKQQDLNFDTAKAAEKAKAQPDKNAPKPDVKAQAKDQGEIGKETAQAAKEAMEANAPAEAKKALDKAQENMQAAKGQLDKPDAQAARPPQANALADLQAAKKAVDQQAAELAQQLGEPKPNDGEAMAKAAEAIDKAQQKLNEAQAQLQKPAALAKQLQEQQKKLAEDLGKAAKEMPNQPQVAAAKQAAEKAAEQLGQNNLPEAIGAMKEALKAIDQAKGNPPAGQEPSPALPQLGQQQQALMDKAQQLAAMNAQPAAEALQAAKEAIEPFAAGTKGPLPGQVAEALQAAQAALSDAAAEAMANNAPPAAANAGEAQQALAEAAAALALAQGGAAKQAAKAGEGQGKEGEGQGQGQGKGKEPGKGTPPPKGTGDAGNFAGTGGTDGQRRDVKGNGRFLALPARERDALLQSHGEKYPQEFGSLVEQFLKNLSDTTGRR
ncbi:MAG: hypothetical protein EXS24_01410 [Pedosphaera sp.]|nr:hypothetical protein [Pedosphaera sp.]